jgi:hypothetical protein
MGHSWIEIQMEKINETFWFNKKEVQSFVQGYYIID